MELALIGEGPPPHCLRKYMLAAGVGEVGGLGAAAIYGHRQLSLREFEEAWMCQQTILRLQADAAKEGGDGASGGGPESPGGEIRRRHGIKKTLKLERDGLLERYEADPSSVVPAWIPRDPGPM